MLGCVHPIFLFKCEIIQIIQPAVFIGVHKHSLITARFLPDSLLGGINSLVVIESLTLEFIFFFWNKHILFIKEKIMNELNAFIKQQIMEGSHICMPKHSAGKPNQQ